MIHRLEFTALHSYTASDAILLPVTLSFAGETVRADAYVDTGSTHCIFKRSLAASLGLDIESGIPLRVGTVTGAFDAFGHTVTIEALDISFETTVYFAEHEGFARNVLGRRGWLDRLRIGIIEYDGRLYASRYDE